MVKRLLLNSLVGLASFALTLAALEAIFRLFFPQPLYAVQFAPWGFFHIPNAEFMHAPHAKYEGRRIAGREYLTHIKYNSKGLRDYEYAYEKAPDVARILILGDSYGEGMEVELEQVHAKVLERMLNQNFAPRKYEVINAGVSAYDTFMELMLLKAEGVKYQPDLIVVLYTGDDDQNAVNPLVGLRPDGTLEIREAQYTRTQLMVRRIKGYIKSRSHFLTFVMDQLNELPLVKRLNQRFDAVSDALIIKRPETQQGPAMSPLPGGDNYPWELTKALFLEMKQVAAAGNAKLLVAPIVGGSPEKKEFLEPAGISYLDISGAPRSYHYQYDGHWNALGHQRAAQLIYEKITQDRLVPLWD